MKSSASFSVKNRPFADQREANLVVNTRSFTRQIGNQKFGSPYCFKDSMSDLSRVFNIIGANSANVKSRALLLNRTLHILKLSFSGSIAMRMNAVPGCMLTAVAPGACWTGVAWPDSSASA
jgi:hypothetical protein